VTGSTIGAAGGICPAGVLSPADEDDGDGEEEEDVSPERRRGSGIGNIFLNAGEIGVFTFTVGVKGDEVEVEERGVEEGTVDVGVFAA
jgi:hypothetical protein